MTSNSLISKKKPAHHFNMRHGSLFSGIGGFDLASEWMGWENVFHCEWNPFGQKVLNHYWPNAITYHDITKTDYTIHRGTIDILTGGFPCQPYSAAGKRLGKDDERHLWPEMLRAIREIQPSYVVGENVRGLTNWNGGLVFDEVQAELEAQGYEVTPFLLPACAVNAPHRRDRIWFVAYNDTYSDSIRFQETRSKQQTTRITRSSLQRNASYSLRYGHESRKEGECSKKRSQSNKQQFKGCNKLFRTNFQMFPTVSPICDGDDGLSDRLDGITFSKWRNESIKAGGNAIVPQVVHQIFKAIEQYNQLNNQLTL
jgi:DNA (cytosine-5)-methyltransferase 1